MFKRVHEYLSVKVIALPLPIFPTINADFIFNVFLSLNPIHHIL